MPSGRVLMKAWLTVSFIVLFIGGNMNLYGLWADSAWSRSTGVDTVLWAVTSLLLWAVVAFVVVMGREEP